MELKQVPSLPRFWVSKNGEVYYKGEGGEFIRKSTRYNSHGYEVIRISHGDTGKDEYKVHHLVLEAFVGPKPDGSFARHLNDDRKDNRLENLAYGTRSQNINDALKNDKWTPRRVNLSPSEIEQIIIDSGTMSQIAVGKKHGISNTTVCKLLKRHRQKVLGI